MISRNRKGKEPDGKSYKNKFKALIPFKNINTKQIVCFNLKV